MVDINKKKKLEKKKKEMEWAAEMMEKLREKNIGFTDNKSGSEMIRELRDAGYK